MQQQLAALLSAALPKEDSATTSSSSSSFSSSLTPSSSSSSSSSSAPVSSSSSSSSTSKPVSGNETDESARLAAINSLHRAILYPPNSLLVSHSASFLSQGLSQLLNDKLYSVRQAAATAYGALCAVVCSIPLTSNRRQNHVVLGSMVDRYIGWALPLLKTGDTTAELALDSLREFLNVGDVNGIERYALPILKACQQLLEDERTSLSLLHRLLGVLTLISLKFFRCFQPHFLDIVDLLLGWALVPDLAESDRHIIMDCFLQFQKHWVGNLQFSRGLLSKFLDDMDALLHDGSPGNQQQFRRLLALLSCFSTVLRSTASGLLEINLLEQISEPLCLMLPRLLGCLSMVGHKFGWSKWTGDLWKCLTLLAEILCEKFSVFYPLAVDTLFQSLEVDVRVPCVGGGKIVSIEVHEVLKTNLQLLSLQKLGLLPSSVQKVLQFDAPISQLRLHPNHIVTASSAATYVFLLQHGNGEVVEQTKDLLLAELKLLKSMLEKALSSSAEVKALDFHSYSKSELFALIKFDLKVLLTCVFLSGNSSSSLIGQPGLAILYLDRSEALLCFIVENLNPFRFPIKDTVELQVNIMTTLEKLSRVELLSKCASCDCNHSSVNIPAEKVLDITLRDSCLVAIMEHLRKYRELLVKALHVSSPLAVKLVALKWVQSFCKQALDVVKHLARNSFFFEPFVYFYPFGNIYASILNGASDREPKVRLHVASIMELLLQVKLVHPMDFHFIGQRILEKLGDPDNDIRNAFVRLLSHAVPIFVYSCGLCEYEMAACMPNYCKHNSLNLHWKQLFALKQLPQQLSAPQLVTILSYISQRWKVPLSTWIKRLIHSCLRSKDHTLSQHEETGNLAAGVAWLEDKSDDDVLENVCSVNVLAGAWWAIQEAARYCIATRLRTNLGGPSQTFAALERMLLDVAHVMQLDSEQNDGSLSIINSSGAHILSMRLLLDFVEALKKNVYNAYEGSAVLPSVSRQSSLFFRANKKVCEEWFSRICEPMMNAGLALQCHYATIEYCTLRLQDIQNLVDSALKDNSRFQVSENLQNLRSRFSGEVLRVLRHLALAMCRCYEPEALVGLQTWVSKTFSSLLIEDCHPVDHAGDCRPLAWINGLVYQAQGQYEEAAAHFTHLLQSEESLSLMGSDGVQFAIARIIESYSAVSDWNSLESWLLELQTLRAKHAGKSYSGALTTTGNDINAILALAHFDEGELQAAWTCLDLTPKSSSELTLDPKVAFQRSEQMLLQALLLQVEGKVEKVPHDLQKAKLMLEEVLSVLPLDGLVDSSAYAIQLHCISALEDGINSGGFQDVPCQLPSLFSSYVHPVRYPISKMYQDCYPWSKVLRVYRAISPTSPVTLSLGMNLLALARKQKNLLLGNHLSCYLRENLFNCSEERFRSSLLSNLEYEEILLKYAHNDFEGAFTSLWSFLHPCLISPVSIVPNSDDSFLKAKACLKLSKWLKGDYSDLYIKIIVPRIQEDLKSVEFSFPVKGGKLSINEELMHKQSIGLITEEIVGTVAKLSTHLCPSMGKSWISYASWCFSQARNSILNLHEAVLQSCSFSSSLVSEVQPDRFRLNEDETTKLRSVMLKLIPKLGDAPGVGETEGGDSFEPAAACNDNCLDALVQQVVDIIEDSAGAPGAENSGSQCLSASVASQLKTFFLHLDMGVEETDLAPAVNEFINIWWSLRRRRVSLFGHAAYGFIQYLSHAAAKGYNGLLMGLGYESVKHRADSLTLRATLYALHILLNYGVELQDSLEPSLSSVPLLPWQEVIPQLFARLSSHPEQVVRRQLQGLLIMLGKRSPWSIVYPTLLDVNANEEKPSEELQYILACLRELHPRLVQDVQLMMNELSNVTVLWEELWLSTLQDLHADVMRRIHVLKEESARIAENAALSQSEKNKINAARYSAMMAPIIVTLERRLASTSRKPETPHELWFHEQYSEQLKSAIFTFKTPPRSAAALGEVWRPFDIIAASLASYQRKSSVCLGDVAPQLALLSSSDVPMPGLEKQGTLSYADGLNDKQEIITISSFSEQVAILSTKTKPKKIVMMGSDGNNYTYLLKGREDLRLDARIMQLLQAVNGLLHSRPATRGRLIGIRYYSVTPISGRAGLIQWVDNVISIYTVFKCWQTRAHAAQLSSSGNGNTKSSVPPPVPRPNDMFYGKIIPALKEKGIRRVISRRDWPHEVKLKVLLDLMKEIPRQLLYQELWCASDGFKEFSLKLKRYSGGVAAMSMVGHILGLGDRHLDNVLVDFGSGDIVHIDYNICFDKGQRLKVPEIVPFRLTQMIEAALGLAGVEGTFRANCEAVMDVLRKNKDIILMLLEVFIWDPLVEWTRGDFHDDAAIGGEERKGMELAVSLSLFASRVQEIRASLQEHHDLLLSTLPAVESTLEKFADILSKYEHVSALFCRVDQERSNLIMHESSAKSIVAEATCTSEKVRQSFEIQAQEFSQAKALVSEKAQEAMSWLEQHGRILEGLRDNLFTEINGWIELGNMGETLSLLRAVSAAGVPLSVVPEPTQAQCLEIDREVCLLVADLDHGISSSLTAIHVYSLALQRILPLNYVTTSKIHGWAQVLQLCSNVLSSDVLSLARRQAADLISNMSNDTHDGGTFAHNDLCLKIDEYSSNMQKIEEECAELVNSLGTETESKAKDRLLSSFMKYIQLGEIEHKEGSNLSQAGPYMHDSTKNFSNRIELVEKREKALYVLNSATTSLYTDIKSRIMDIGNTARRPLSDSSTVISELEEQVEKLSLISSFQMELQQFTHGTQNTDHEGLHSKECWPSIFQNILGSSKSFVDQMAEIVLPNVIRIAISFNSEVLDTFGPISQVRGAIDTAFEQLVEVEMERESLVELEQNYFVRVGLITEQQLALKEAAVKGRDHLSWEEAEELASQEEACRAQLDLLHQTWHQRDKRTSTLIKREAEVKNSLTSSEKLFHTLTVVEQDVVSQASRSKALLASLIRPFSELDSLDKVLSSMSGTLHAEGFPKLTNMLKSGYSVSESIWKVGGSLSSHAFFIWKIFVVDAFLDSCIQDVALSADQNLGFEQLLNALKKKIVIQLEKLIGQYLKERVLPLLVVSLDSECERLKQLRSSVEEPRFEIIKKDIGAVKKVKLMLEEFCNAHETARAARSAASRMKRQVNELKEAICKTGMEIVQMEWMHDALLTTSHNSRATLQKYLSGDDDLHPIVTKLSRSRLLEVLHSTVSGIAQSVESLQNFERTTHTAEGQLERAMGWACGGPSSSVAGNTSGRLSGIPPQFHEHLARRRQLLWDAREKASNIAKICMSVLEFEASRDGILWVPGERPVWTSNDRRAWQQTYFNSLTRLEVAYHSFSRVELEWNLAQSSMEAASNGLYSATNELCIASVKAKSASDDLHNTVLSMRDCAYEASMALSAFCRVMRGHTALTSECSSMLEEVLAITEDLHDVNSLGKEAASVHRTLMDDLAKASAILLPLESVLSKDVTAMTEAISRERESKMGISPIHGQAIYQSYFSRVREACQAFKPLLPSLLQSVKDLLVILTRLARTASLHAGNLHKALEGVGESQEEKSEGVDMLRPDFSGNVSSFDGKEGGLSGSDEEATQEILEKVSLQEKAWLSPPDSICNSSSEASFTSSDAGFPDVSYDQKSDMVQQLHNFDSRDEAGHLLTDFSSQADVCQVTTYNLQAQCVEIKNADTGLEALVMSEPLPHTEIVASQANEHAIVPLQSSCSSHEEDSKMKLGDKNEQFSDRSKVKDETDVPEPGTHAIGRVARGKNSYAMSVLRRVEMKIDGQDIADTRDITVAEQVDYLLKQATSVDNLCNMYEGWTPWI